MALDLLAALELTSLVTPAALLRHVTTNDTLLSTFHTRKFTFELRAVLVLSSADGPLKRAFKAFEIQVMVAFFLTLNSNEMVAFIEKNMS